MTSVAKRPGVLFFPRLTTRRSTTSDTRSGRPSSKWPAMAASNQSLARRGWSNAAVSAAAVSDGLS